MSVQGCGFVSAETTPDPAIFLLDTGAQSVSGQKTFTVLPLATGQGYTSLAPLTLGLYKKTQYDYEVLITGGSIASGADAQLLPAINIPEIGTFIYNIEVLVGENIQELYIDAVNIATSQVVSFNGVQSNAAPGIITPVAYSFNGILPCTTDTIDWQFNLSVVSTDGLPVSVPASMTLSCVKMNNIPNP